MNRDEIEKYVLEALLSFESDPCDSPYQRGYLSGLLSIWDHAINNSDMQSHPMSARIDEIRKQR